MPVLGKEFYIENSCYGRLHWDFTIYVHKVVPRFKTFSDIKIEAHLGMSRRLQPPSEEEGGTNSLRSCLLCCSDIGEKFPAILQLHARWQSSPCKAETDTSFTGPQSWLRGLSLVNFRECQFPSKQFTKNVIHPHSPTPFQPRKPFQSVHISSFPEQTDIPVCSKPLCCNYGRPLYCKGLVSVEEVTWWGSTFQFPRIKNREKL